MSCEPCLLIASFDICCTDLTIGTVALAGEYRTIITDLSTGAKFSYVSTVAANNDLLTIQPNDIEVREYFFTTNRTYALETFIQTASDCNTNTPANITRGEDVETCFSFEFLRMDNITTAP